jgi:hypothetical protein
MGMEDDHLVIADRHIAEGEKIVAAQRILIAKMLRTGADTMTAQSTLTTFLSSLDSFYSHREHILRTIAKGK